ncbi:hypothetical protein [Streptomyces sp. NPDC090057]|uniref:hypothetical protein n=1 Tax=Streptomyces sp. NPDC090057 TaxID=3365935 RepID=UPI00382DA429
MSAAWVADPARALAGPFADTTGASGGGLRSEPDDRGRPDATNAAPVAGTDAVPALAGRCAGPAEAREIASGAGPGEALRQPAVRPLLQYAPLTPAPVDTPVAVASCPTTGGGGTP